MNATAQTASAKPAAATAAGPGGQPDLASRLRAVRVGLRDDLEVSRHVFRGESAYIVRDPVTFQSHRFGVADYEILVRLNTAHTLGDIFESLVKSESLDREAEQDFYQFVFSLHRLGFLNLPFSDEKLLYKRHKGRQESKRKALWMSVLSLQIPLVNPNAFLARTLHLAAWAFTPRFFFAWCLLIASAAWMGFARRDELLQPLDGILATGNLLVMWTTLVLLKVIHELGHAYACKRLGGDVPEMGITLIMLTPCAYVDATASWGFGRKLDRIIVALAGMYFELTIAAIAMFVWALTEPGIVHAAAYNVIFLASATTILFNINPLMRYDGYYILSDLVEIPNLRQRATESFTRLMKHLALGLPSSGPRQSWILTVKLIAFGAASAAYRLMMIVGITTILSIKFGAIGLLGGFGYVAMIAASKVRKLVEFASRSEETAAVRRRAVVLSVAACVVAPLALLALPIQSAIQAPAVVGAESETVLRARAPAFVRDVPAPPGRTVVAGETLVRLDNDDLTQARLEAQTRVDVAKLRRDAKQAKEAAVAQQESMRLGSAERELSRRVEDEQSLTVRAPLTGRSVEGLMAGDVGRFVPPGTPLATIVSGTPRLRVILTESELAAAAPNAGDRVVFRAAGAAQRDLHGRVERVEPLGDRRVAIPSLTLIGGGDIAVDPATGESTQPYFQVLINIDDAGDADLRYGMVGRVRFAADWEPLGLELYRRFLRLAAMTQAG